MTKEIIFLLKEEETKNGNDSYEENVKNWFRLKFFNETNLHKMIKCRISIEMLDFLTDLWRWSGRRYNESSLSKLPLWSDRKNNFGKLVDPETKYPLLSSSLVKELLTLAEGDSTAVDYPPLSSVLCDDFSVDDRKWWTERKIPDTWPKCERYNSTHVALQHLATLPGSQGVKFGVTNRIQIATLFYYYFDGEDEKATLRIRHLGDSGQPDLATTLTRGDLLNLLSSPDLHLAFAEKTKGKAKLHDLTKDLIDGEG